MRAALPSLVLAAGLAAFAASPAQAGRLMHLIVVNGTCEQLILGQADYSNDCKAAVMQMIYDDGRNGFYIGLNDQSKLFAFSGFDGEKPDPDTILQRLDQVIFGPDTPTGTATATPVTGTCLYGNPYKGETRIICSAKDADGALYDFKFKSDGSRPQKIM